MIKNLNDNDLLLEIKKLVKEEKRITGLVLDYLAEVETRRLYALRGYPSLFEFCIKELGYSESASNRRISAMRAMKAIPEAKAKFEEGSVNLSTLSQLQSFIKREEKINGKLKIEEKMDLLKTIENKSQKQCEKEFIKLSPEIIKLKESQRPVTEDLTEIKFMASTELTEKLKKVQGLLSHKDVQSMANLIETLADMALKKVSPETQRSTSAAEVQSATIATRHISKKQKQRVWLRDEGKCQYIDLLTKRKCESRHFLQYDHIVPVAFGGLSTEENLRLLCRAHNQVQAITHFSKKHMEKFISTLR